MAGATRRNAVRIEAFKVSSRLGPLPIPIWSRYRAGSAKLEAAEPPIRGYLPITLSLHISSLAAASADVGACACAEMEMGPH